MVSMLAIEVSKIVISKCRLLLYRIQQVLRDLGVPILARLPIRPAAASMIDHGDVESVQMPEIVEAVDALTK